MRLSLVLLLAFGWVALAHAVEPAAGPAAGRVVKVLPFMLDQQGRMALSPSLFDRDAYQAKLRQHPDQIYSVRYDVLWSVQERTAEPLTLRLELRGTDNDRRPKLKTLTAAVKPGWLLRRWTSFTLDREEYQDFAAITAWRATLWRGDQMMAEQKSFLW